MKRTSAPAFVGSSTPPPTPTPQLAVETTSVTVAEGGTASLRVRLTAAPTGTVTVTATENDADISLTPASRSFTTSNWNTYQAFTVTGLQDPDTVHDSATVTLRASGGGVSDTASVTVTITDDDVPPTDTVPTFGTTTIPDQSYTVGTAIPTLQLPAASGGDSPLTYTVTPTLPAGLTFAATTRQLTGTPTTAMGATTYTYTVTDADHDTATLTFALTVVDPNLPANWLGQGTSTDPYIISGLPVAAAEIGALIRGTGTGSGSGSATYFRFTATQAGPHTIAIETTLSPASGDWDLRGDRDLRGTSSGSNEADTVTLPAGAVQNFWIYPYNASARSNLAGMRLTITPPPPAVSGTGVSTDPYVIPAALLNTDLDCTLLPNWSKLTNSGAFFRVTVPTTGTWTATFTFAPSPKRVEFDGVFNTSTTTEVASPITATAVLSAGATVTFDVDPYIFTLGTLTSATLRLDAPVAGSAPGVPTNVSGSSVIDQNGDQTVTVSWEAPTSGGTLTTYRAQFYDSYSTFWVGTTTTTGTSASQFYSTQGIWITRVRVRAENNTGNSAWVEASLIASPPQLTLAAPTVTVAEGGTATIQVRLTAQPTGTVTVTSAETDADISLSPASRSFTTSTWNTYQTFTVTGLQDSDTVDDSATVTLSVSGGGVSDTASVTVTITDDDLATTPHTVTYSDTTPGLGTQVTATLSATTGISSYQWQYQRPSESR